MAMNGNTLTLLAGGDIIVGNESARYLEGVKDMLASGDVVVGQLEVPYTNRAREFLDLERNPDNLLPLLDYFDVLTLGGNHIYDAKDVGVLDTLDWLDSHGMPHAGGGRNLEEAVRPAIIEKDGVRFGFLNYNCTGPKATSAGPDKPGCAFIDIIIHFDMGIVANPGGNPEHIYTWPEPKSFEAMQRDVTKLRRECDVLCVYFHKGIVHKPIKLADYEKVVAHAAIECGADVVFSSHSHVLHGVEIYKGKTIYHGLNNFIAWVPSLSPKFRAKNGVKNDLFDPEEWARNRIERFGFVPDDAYPTYPFHPDSIYTVTAKCLIRDRQIVETRLIPMIVAQSGIPCVVSRDGGGERVMEYLKKITDGAGLNARLAWDGDEIMIS
jgi:poly-gamma-glutamate capsule biosynthesis protein CapA/YwtB (metallophosphatase superfamily)